MIQMAEALLTTGRHRVPEALRRRAASVPPRGQLQKFGAASAAFLIAPAVAFS